ncbi:MAG: serine hydrolase domain-containing protein [Eubacterium sp.]
MDINHVFDAFLEKIKREGVVLNYVQVRQHGKTILDWGRLNQKTRLNTWSVSKSFVSVAVGIAMDEGLLSLDEKICDSFREYLPENPSTNLMELTVRNLLTMTTGLESPLFFGDDPDRYTTEDWIGYFFTQQFSYKPGERFLYSNFNTYILACLVERKAGMDIMEYLTPRLFIPLEIYSPDWTRCPEGHIHGANGLYLTIDEFGNFGQMVLDGGVFHNRQIVSKKYLKMATENQLPEDWETKYGFQFWINRDEKSCRADGKYGQFIFILPQHDMVIAVQSLDSGYVLKELWYDFIEKLD